MNKDVEWLEMHLQLYIIYLLCSNLNNQFKQIYYILID